MEIKKESLENGQIIKLDVGTELNNNQLSGTVELDIENQAQFVGVINDILDKSSSKLIINMKNISYIDSSGLWAIFEGHKKAVQQNSNLVLISPTKDVKRVLDITKMSSKVQIFDTEALAIKNLLSD